MFMPSGVAAAASVGTVFTLTAGAAGQQTGFADGVSAGPFGTINPAAYKGADIVGIRFDNTIAVDDLIVEIDGGATPQNFWTQMQIIGVFAGGQATQTFVSANADLFSNPGAQFARWTFFNGTDEMINGNVYTVIIS